MVRIAVVVSHPIQHFAPWYRATAALPGIELKVLYCSLMGAESYYDPSFGIKVKWDIPLLDGYNWELLESRKEIRQLTFLSTDNPDVGRELERFVPDVVLVHGYAYRTMWRASAWCHENGVPLLLYSDSNVLAVSPVWKRVFKKALVRSFYRRVDGAISVGNNNYAYHLQYGIPESRLFRGALPIDVRRIIASAGDLVSARNEIRMMHGIPQKAFLVVLSGKLIPRKSPQDVVKAIARCAERGLDVWAILVGEGSERPSIEALLTKGNISNVVLAGFVNQSMIGRYYASSDALVVSSEYDPHPLVVPEAGCFGLPVIASDRIGCIGSSDTAREDENALIYPHSDIDALTERMTRLYQNNSLYESMSAAARQIAESQDISVAAEQVKSAAIQLKALGCRP